MRTNKLLRNGFVVATGFFLCGTAVADNCTGYDILVTTSADTRDLGNGMTLTVIGVALGLIGAFALTRVMSGILFGVTATDSLTYISVSAGLIVVALLACYVPARRAMRVDPLLALQHE